MSDKEENTVNLGVVPAQLISEEVALKLLREGHLLVKAEMEKGTGDIKPVGLTQEETQEMADNYGQELLKHTDAKREEIEDLLKD